MNPVLVSINKKGTTAELAFTDQLKIYTINIDTPMIKIIYAAINAFIDVSGLGDDAYIPNVTALDIKRALYILEYHISSAIYNIKLK
jgi:hypothetical protein